MMSDRDAKQLEIDIAQSIHRVITDEEFIALNEEEQGIVRRNFFNTELLILARELACLRMARRRLVAYQERENVGR